MSGSWLDHLALVSLGLIVAAIAAIPARRLLRRDPSACYRLCLVLLFGALALLPLQWIVQGAAREWIAPARDGIVRWLEPAPPRPRSPLLDDGAILVNAPYWREPGERSDAAGPAAPPVVALRSDDAAGAALRSRAPIELGAARTARLGSAPKEALSSWTPHAGALAEGGRRFVSALRVATAWLEGRFGWTLWLAGIAIVLGRRLLGVVRTLRLLRAARPVTDPELLAVWRHVAGRSRVADRVRLLGSEQIASPACVGWFRPILLLPGGSQPALRKEVLSWALRHELVHLERGDSRIAALQSLVTALLWFHPAAWWLSAEIGRLRELSCDQLVVGGSGRRRSYALALLEYAAVRNGTSMATDAGPHSAGVRCALLHWSRSPSQMQRRIEMLTVDQDSASTGRRTAGRLFALCAFVAPALAQVGVAATLLPKDGGATTVQAAAAPVAQPSATAAPAVSVGVGVGVDGRGRAAAVAPAAAPCVVAGTGEGCCAQAGAPQPSASPQPNAKQMARHRAPLAAPARGAVVSFPAQADDERAAVRKALARSQARAHELRAKLEAAEAADDDDACAALEAALDRCEADREAAEEACEAECEEDCEEDCDAECEAECEELADAVDELGYLNDLEVGFQELPELEVLAIQLGELGYVTADLADVTEELPAIQEEVRRAVAGANDEIAAAMRELAAAKHAQHALDADDKQALEAKLQRLLKEKKRAATAQSDGAARRAKHAAAGARAKEADEPTREEVRARIEPARKAGMDAATQVKVRRAQELAVREQELVQRAQEQARSRQEFERARVHSGQARSTPVPSQPRTPWVDTTPEPPHPADAPLAPRSGAVRTRSSTTPAPPRAPGRPVAPTPPGVDPRALLERIAALEAEIAELRAALHASRHEQQPADAPPAPDTPRRSRSLR